MANRMQQLRWTIPLILFATTIIDAALPAIFPNAFLNRDQIVVSHLTLYFIVTFAFYFRDDWILPYSFIFGLFYDSYNTTILGLNALIYFLMALFVLKFKKYLPKNMFFHGMLFIVTIFFTDTIVYIFYNQLNINTMHYFTFLTTRLAPTLVFNVVLALLMHLPKKELLRWLGWEDYIIF